MMLRGKGYDVDEASDGAKGIELVKSCSYEVVLTDLRMGEYDGIEVLRVTKETQPTTEVIVMTAYGTIESAVEAMRVGAFDYIQKPFTEQELIVKVGRARESRRLQGQVQAFAQEFKERYGFENIVGRSRAIRDVLARIVKIGPTNATVLITGEGGTGKELMAKALHANSSRAARPFVSVDCTSVSEQALESELFGHVRNAFPGAKAARRGLFEEASGSTIFVDNVEHTSKAFQAKLLRAIQNGELCRLGTNKSERIDVRVIVGTAEELQVAVREGRFREDLFYRLGVVRLALPPLRERREDIAPLVAHLLKKFSDRTGVRTQVGPEVLEYLQGHPLPGNVTQLQSLLEQGALMAQDGRMRLDDIRGQEPRNRRPVENDDAASIRPVVFISYARQDWPWLKQLQVHLKPLEQRGLIDRWDDSRIRPGTPWRDEIAVSLDRAKLAILLLSPDFLASDFITQNELPPLLEAASLNRTRILSVVVRPCLLEEHEDLQKFSMLGSTRPLSSMARNEQEEALVEIARSVIQEVRSGTARSSGTFVKASARATLGKETDESSFEGAQRPRREPR
jgi:two-component system, NtrC family, response regulator HydG